MRPQDRMLVVPFSQTLGPITGPTDDRATVVESIGRIDVARRHRDPRLADRSSRRISPASRDAGPSCSSPTATTSTATRSFEDALAAVKSVQATVYVVGIGGVAGISLKGERLLKQLAAETGGRAFLPSREEELEIVHDVLASDVQNRYLLSYTPSNQEIDGTWRTITVETGDPDPQGARARRLLRAEAAAGARRRSSSRSPMRSAGSSTSSATT